MSRVLDLTFGAMAKPIATQLKKQKLSFDQKAIPRFQKILDCILMLSFQGYLSASLRDKAEAKLFKEILKHVKEQEAKSINNNKGKVKVKR